MLIKVIDFSLFAKYWKRCERFLRGEGFADTHILQMLAGKMEDDDMARKIAVATTHWLINYLTDEEREDYQKCFQIDMPVPNEAQVLRRKKGPIDLSES